MFTGIIEEVGIVKAIKALDKGLMLSVNSSKINIDLKLGDSVSVNGACQTVIRFDKNSFDVEVSEETLNVTNLKLLKTGDKVNLERAMPANGRFDGHIVTGHIDGLGEFSKRETEGAFYKYYFSAPDSVEKYLVYKGSICINGISLTVASLEGNLFSVAVIPHSAENTNLVSLREGDKINLESDILAKYVEKFTQRKDNTTETVTYEYLQEHGFA